MIVANFVVVGAAGFVVGMAAHTLVVEVHMQVGDQNCSSQEMMSTVIT